MPPRRFTRVLAVGMVLALMPTMVLGAIAVDYPIAAAADGEVEFDGNTPSMPVYSGFEIPRVLYSTGNIREGGSIVAPSVSLAVRPAFSTRQNLATGLTFNFTKGPGILALESGTPSQQALAANVVAGFQTAGNWWSSILMDPVTVNVTIDYEALGPGILGSTSNNTAQAYYGADIKPALIADAKSADDAIAVANLQPGNSLDMFTNDTSVTPSPRIRDNDGSANNSILDVPRANLKALGLLNANDPAEDGAISFSSNFSWDFDPNNGIGPSAFNFVGVSAHEIGHLLGFVSGVDMVDLAGGSGPYAPTDLNADPVFSVLDLYRYTYQSWIADNQPTNGAVLDLAYDNTPFFSIEPGVSILGMFATGYYNGDHSQASHWKDNSGLGIMDPTVAPGEMLEISTLDLLAMDVIGWDTVPEPSTFVLLCMGSFALVALAWRRRGR